MIQYKVFTGTLAEIEAAFNGWAASLVNGVNINSGPLTMIPNTMTMLDDGVTLAERWYKEVVYVLPVAGAKLAVPQPIARANGRN